MIRQAAERDAAGVLAIYEPIVRDTPISFEMKPPTEEEMAARFVNAFAGIALPNPVSVRLFESFGFEKVSQQKNVGFKLGAWHDVGWWQRQLRVPTTPPPDISPRAPVVLG
jgi:L-amino acid N-acyltransferase YncA